MKILIDENLSWRVKKSLSQYFTEVTHISDFRKLAESDQQIWDWSKKSNYPILRLIYLYKKSQRYKTGYPQ